MLADILAKGGEPLELHSPPLEEAASAAGAAQHAPHTGSFCSGLWAAVLMAPCAGHALPSAAACTRSTSLP